VPTTKGPETSFAVSYWSRLRLVSNLLPLLQRAEHPRVMSILNGTKEARIDEQDITLYKTWSIIGLVKHTTLLTSLSFDYLSKQDVQKKLTFIHTTPGLVNTGTPRTTGPSMKDGVLWWAFLTFVQVVSGWVIIWTGYSFREAGERHAYLLTTDTIGPGSWRVDNRRDVAQDNQVLVEYRERGWEERAWEETQRVWEQALEKGNWS
jgi:hypothetical protein